MKKCSTCQVLKPWDDFYWKRKAKKEKQPVCKACQKITNKSSWRAPQLRSRYGLTIADLSDMKESQNGRCAICNIKPKDSLCVDHDAETGKVRGLLCRKCNMAIGLLHHDTDILLFAIEYLEQT